MRSFRHFRSFGALIVSIGMFAGIAGSSQCPAGGITNFADAVDLPRSTQKVGVSLDTGNFSPGNYSLQYITGANISQMLMPWLWPAQSASPGDPTEVSYAIVQGAIGDVYDGGDVSLIRQAADVWSDIDGCAFSFAETPFDNHWGLGDGSNEIGWMYDYDTWTALELPPEVIGVTYTFYNGYDYAEFDILLNAVYFYWYADSADPNYSQPDAMHVGNIVLHELGHGAGLLDLYNAGQPGYERWMGLGNEDATMYGYASDHDADMTLSWSDESAMRLAYPVPEPAGLVLLAAGFMGILAWKRGGRPLD